MKYQCCYTHHFPLFLFFFLFFFFLPSPITWASWSSLPVTFSSPLAESIFSVKTRGFPLGGLNYAAETGGCFPSFLCYYFYCYVFCSFYFEFSLLISLTELRSFSLSTPVNDSSTYFIVPFDGSKFLDPLLPWMLNPYILGS
jgi:hypothetical protein